MALGIDPGLTGAAVLLGPEHLLGASGSPPEAFLVQDHTIPNKRRGRGYDYRALARWIRGIQDRRLEPVVVLETVRGQKGAATSSCSIGTGFGLWLGIVAMTGWQIHLVPPATWHRALKLGQGEPKANAARYARDRIPALDPYLGGRFRKAHEGIVDAACLAAYGLWLERSLLAVPEPPIIDKEEAARIVDYVAKESAIMAAAIAKAATTPKRKRSAAIEAEIMRIAADDVANDAALNSMFRITPAGGVEVVVGPPPHIMPKLAGCHKKSK